MRLRRSRSPSNVFVLGTGRCGTTTIAAACGHLTNFTAGHETRSGLLGDDRLAYPPNHIEADNRLTWLLGRLAARYGDQPLYVHLRREPEAVIASFERRWGTGIIDAYNGGIIMQEREEKSSRAVCQDYVATVTANIDSFLVSRTNSMTVWLEESGLWFPHFWDRIDGEGDIEAAMFEFNTMHNASKN